MGDQVEMKVLGKLMEPFNPATMDWTTYESLLKRILKLHKITDEDARKSYIMLMIGMTAYAELNHALDGKDVDELESDDLLALLRGRYAPKKLVVAQRDRLLSIKQKPSQSFNELMANCNN